MFDQKNHNQDLGLKSGFSEINSAPIVYCITNQKILVDFFQSEQIMLGGEMDERSIFIPAHKVSCDLNEEDIKKCIPKVGEHVEIFSTLGQAQQAIRAKQEEKNDEKDKPFIYKTPLILEACIYKEGQLDQLCPVKFLTFKRVICPPNVAKNRIPDISQNFQRSVSAFILALKKNETLWQLKVPKVLKMKIVNELNDLAQEYPKQKSNSYCSIL